MTHPLCSVLPESKSGLLHQEELLQARLLTARLSLRMIRYLDLKPRMKI